MATEETITGVLMETEKVVQGETGAISIWSYMLVCTVIWGKRLIEKTGGSTEITEEWARGRIGWASRPGTGDREEVYQDSGGDFDMA